MKNKAVLSLIGALVLSSNCVAQNPYIGLWQGYFHYVMGDGSTKTSKFQLQFHQMVADTLYARVIDYDPNDTTKVNGMSETFKAGFRRESNMFYYFGAADKTPKKKINGLYLFRFTDTGNQTILGEFYPEVERKNDPKITAKFHRIKSAQQQNAFIAYFREKFYAGRKKNLSYLNCKCDDRVYGIIKGFIDEPEKDRLGSGRSGAYSNGRSIREMSSLYPAATLTKIHREVIPFPSVALAKGFDNILYTVSSNSTDVPERVYAYNPATGEGAYTRWTLPVPTVGDYPYGVWLSGGTDREGNLYFMTEPADKLVKINPVTDEVSTIWSQSPLGKRANSFNNNPLFRYDMGFGNFCFDEDGYLYIVTSNTGKIVKMDIRDTPKIVDMFAVEGLPETGMLAEGNSYGDILIQKDALGVNHTYVTGRYEIFEIDLVRKTLVKAVAQFHNADLAGCNIFRKIESEPQKDENIPITSGADTPFIPETKPPVAALEKPSILEIKFVQSKDEFIDDRTAKDQINKWIEMMKINPKMTIKISGHTDNVGNPKVNKNLSELRAAKVKSYMVSKGIAPARIAVEGFGGDKPLVPNDSNENMAMNRRVEVDIISK